MTKDGATLAVDPSSLIGNLFALLPIPVAVVDVRGEIVMSNSTFNDFFPETKNINRLPRYEVQVEGRATFDFDTVPLTDQGLSIFIGRETTSERQLRHQLVHMEKMGAIGRLVTGVAHELNNPLAGIVCYAQLLSRGDLDPSAIRMVEVLRAQAERAGKIVQNFLSLATKTEPERRPFALNGLIKNVLSLREYDHSVRDIVVSSELSPDLPNAAGDSGQIEQVLLNLIVNAEEAVQELHDRVPEIQVRTEALGNKIRLEVTDNGSGIHSRDMNRIFDPFFTTKNSADGGGGTGLGLNICAEIVKDHGGELYAWSNHGAGSTFTMELPVEPAEIHVEAPPERSNAGALVRGKSIMVIDDEVTITELIDDLLSRYGAKVDFFNCGAQAFDHLCVKSYDAIVCDQRMPGVNGQSLYRMVESLDPEMARRFLFVTGDVLNDRTKQFFAQTGARYLRKPFRLDDLLRAIEGVLK